MEGKKMPSENSINEIPKTEERQINKFQTNPKTSLSTRFRFLFRGGEGRRFSLEAF
jgi:hypothetical protein